MPTLSIHLLGPPTINSNDQPMNVQRRMIRSLLYYLACHKDPIDRASLMLMFWPDEDEKTARRRLREILSKLRAELPDPDLLVIDQNQVGLQHSRVYVDVLEFNELFQQSNRIANSFLRHLPLPESTHQIMKQAIGLWRTPHFMAGVRLPNSSMLDHWLSETSTQLERRRAILIERLSDHYAASGDFESAVSWLNTILEEDPDNLTWQMHYLSWLLNLGRHNEAEAYYSYLYQYYQETGEPMPEKLISLSVQIQKPNIPERTADHPFWPPQFLLQTAFIGRQNELQALNSALQRRGVIVLKGESGSGKTRLVYEFSKQHTAAARVMVSLAHASTQHLPYHPLIEMLRLSVSQEEWGHISPNWLSPLALLMPELNQYLQQPSRLEDTFLEDIQGVIFESLHQVLKEISGSKTMLFILDDAHFADQTTLDALAYLVSRGFFDQYGLLAITTAPEQASSVLGTSLQKIQKTTSNRMEIHLPELRAREVSDLIASVLGKRYPNDIVQKLVENASGQPLQLIETLRAVLEYAPGVDLAEVIDNLPLPKSTRELIYGKMETLSQPALTALRITAIAGGSITPALIEKAASMDTEEVVRVLEELQCKRLIQMASSTSTGPVYTFQYGRIRETVLSELNAARRRMLHLSVAKAMQSLPLESSNPSLIAQHYETAGEIKAAFDHWVKAGILAAQMFSGAETRHCFRRAYALLQPLGDFVTDEEIYQLFLVWGDYLDDIADFESEKKLYFELQALGSQRDSNLLLGAAFNGLCRYYRRTDEYEKSLHYNNLAIAHLENGPLMPEYLFAFNRRAVTLALLGEFEPSLAALRKAIELAHGRKERRIQIGISGVFLQIALIWHFKGMPEKSLEVADLADRSLFSSINDPDIEMIRITRAQAYAALGFPIKAYELCDEVLQKAFDWNNNRLEAFAKMIRSYAAMSMGLMEESLENVEDALSIAEQFNYFNISQQSYCHLGDIYRLVEEYKLAQEAHQNALQHPTRSYYRLDNEIRLIYSQILMGEVAQGISALDNLIQEAVEGDFNYITLTATIMKVSALIRNNEVEQAERLLQKIIQDCDEQGIVIIKANIRLYEGICALKNGDLIKAKKLLEDSIQITHKNNNVWVESAALDALYTIFESQGEDTSEITSRILQIREHVLNNSRREDLRRMVERAFQRKRAISMTIESGFSG